MDYKSVSSKMPMNEVTQFKAFCENKGVSPASLIRELILREIGVPVPSTVAGRNMIAYDREKDRFTWSVALDSGEVVEVLGNVAPQFLEELGGMIARGLDERDSFIGRVRDDSVPVPSGIVRRRG
ncbi:MAG: hypothetical protein SCH70_11560 [Candidatus Methanoperedens sp.]|nr:hypothetical protein [Candidatus Methanoperedens sp.]